MQDRSSRPRYYPPPHPVSNRTADHRSAVHPPLGAAPRRLPPAPGPRLSKRGCVAIGCEAGPPRSGHRTSRSPATGPPLRTRHTGRAGPRGHQETRAAFPTLAGTENSTGGPSATVTIRSRSWATPSSRRAVDGHPGWRRRRNTTTSARRRPPRSGNGPEPSSRPTISSCRQC
jgi:hypothetical protein